MTGGARTKKLCFLLGVGDRVLFRDSKSHRQLVDLSKKLKIATWHLARRI